MKATRRVLLVAVAVLLTAGTVWADGMIVPIRPDIQVRGSWAVKYHHVDIKVRNQVAAVSIDQEFVNTGRGTIEVEYLFPVPPGAAIDSMTLVVNGKEFAARLLEADEARKIYESIVRKKKDPALLEYVGFGLYKTRAFPLVPGTPAKVLVTYKNICKKDRDLVEVWYPLNTEKFSAKAIDSVRVRVDVKSAVDIGPVYSPTHDLSVKRKAPGHVIATYAVKAALPTSDFQMFYKASNEKIGATLVTHQGKAKKDGHFMLLVSPNPRASGASRVAKDVMMVFDHSGSMSGKKLAQAKEALYYVLHNLNRDDRFNIVVYNDSVEWLFSPQMMRVSKSAVSEAIEKIDALEATGGTNIDEALTAALGGIPGGRKKRPAYVIFLTDGKPTVGEVNEKNILQNATGANKAGARVFAFGVGYQPNVRLLDKLVIDHNGRSDYVKPTEDIETKVSSLYNKIKNPVMTDLTIELEGVKLRNVYPRKLSDLFDGDQLVVVGRYDCREASKLPKRGGARQTTLVVKGTYQGKPRGFEYNVALRPSGQDVRYVFVEKIWAIRRVGYLLDEIQLHGKSSEVIAELIRLSKTYGIMTPYTSFLADETAHRAPTAALHSRAERLAKGLARDVAGEAAQMGAMTRQKLNESIRMVPAAAPGSRVNGKSSSVLLYGNTGRESYESEKVEYVAGVRNVGNLTLYRRGRVWMGADTTALDLVKEADKVQVVHRFSEAYFELVRRNTVAENQVMASQQADEELVLTLRGRVYHVK